MRVEKVSYRNYKDKVLDVVHFLKNEREIFRWSFNNGFFRKSNEEANKEIKKIKKKLKEDYNIDLNDFFNKYKREIFNDPQFTNCCAILDYLLYTYDKNGSPLSGYYMDDELYPVIPEYYIKYNYNYAKYDIGKKFILQNFGDMDTYYKKTAELLIKSFLENEYIFPKKDISKSYSVKNIYGGCYLIYCDMKKLETLLDNDEYRIFTNALNRDKPFDNFTLNDNILQIYINCDDIKKYNL